MSFLENYRNTIEQDNSDKQDIADYERYVDNFARTYSAMSGVADDKELRKKIKMAAFNAGVVDVGLSDASSNAEIARYGKEFLNEFGPEGDLSFTGFLRASGDDKALKNWEKYQDYAATHGQKDREGEKKVKDANTYAPIVGGAVGLGMPGGGYYAGAFGAGAGKVAGIGVDAAEGWQKVARDASGTNAFNKSWGKYGSAYSDYTDKTWGLVENLLNDYGKVVFKKSDFATDSDDDKSDAGESTDTSSDETEGEEITYTYKPGDTFGQVIMDLGLNTEKGLWGDDGDVAFYDKQLWAQGAPDPVTGNIPIGTTIKLRKRKV